MKQQNAWLKYTLTVGHILSLMSIWQYSRGGDRAIRGADQARGATLEQRRAIGGATYIYAIYMPKKRSYRSISEQEEPLEEQVKRSKPIYAFINTIGSCSGNENPHMHVLTLSGVEAKLG